MIGEIEHFGAELQPLPLTHGKEFLQGEVRLLQRWSNNGVASGITERCQATTRHAAECSTVVPTIGTRIVDMPVPQDVRALCANRSSCHIGWCRGGWIAGLQWDDS